MSLCSSCSCRLIVYVETTPLAAPAGAGEDQRDQVGEALPDARPGLDGEVALLLERVGHGRAPSPPAGAAARRQTPRPSPRGTARPPARRRPRTVRRPGVPRRPRGRARRGRSPGDSPARRRARQACSHRRARRAGGAWTQVPCTACAASIQASPKVGWREWCGPPRPPSARPGSPARPRRSGPWRAGPTACAPRSWSVSASATHFTNPSAFARRQGPAERREREPADAHGAPVRAASCSVRPHDGHLGRREDARRARVRSNGRGRPPQAVLGREDALRGRRVGELRPPVHVADGVQARHGGAPDASTGRYPRSSVARPAR